MIAWEINSFYGVSPRTPEARLKPGFATQALDVNLAHGTLKPWRELKLLYDAPPNTLRIHSFGCCVYNWSRCVSVAEWLPNCPRLYITGRASYPEVAFPQDNCRLTYQRVGVCIPNNAPSLSYTPDTSPTVNTDERAYCYTFKNNLGEEGGPSYASTGAMLRDGASVDVYGFETPSLEYNVTTICLYRRVTGFRTGLEKEQEVVTEWLLVGEFPVDTQTITDNILLKNLGRILATKEVREPPADLKNITAVADSTLLAGNVSNRLYFTTHHQPWNWPVENEITLDDNVVAMASVGGDLFVATDGYPYVIAGDPGPERAAARSVHKFPYPLPMIACASGRGAIATPMGMLYVGQDGLVLLTKSGAKVITDALFAFDDWRKLRPETMRLAYYAGAVYCVSEKVSFVLWMDGSTYTETEYQRLSMISDKPTDMVLTRNGQLLFLVGNQIYQWNAGSRWRKYVWTSEPVNAMTMFSITRVYATVLDHNTVFALSCEHGEFSRVLGAPFDRSFSVRPMGRHTSYYVQFSGIGEVTYAKLSVSNEELGGRGG